jgi:ankyrin repeat protein
MTILGRKTGRTIGVLLPLTILLCWGCQDNEPRPAEDEAPAAEAPQAIDVDDKQPLGHPTLHEAASGDDLADVKRHLARGAALDGKDKAGCTALHYAAMGGHMDVAAFLIDQGADVNARTIVVASGLFTPLHFAAFNGHKDVAALLMKRGADVDAKTDDGSTPLFYAAMMGKVDVAELLIAEGAQVGSKNNEGHTPLQTAAEVGQRDVIALLNKHGAKE